MIWLACAVWLEQLVEFVTTLPATGAGEQVSGLPQNVGMGGSSLAPIRFPSGSSANCASSLCEVSPPSMPRPSKLALTMSPASYPSVQDLTTYDCPVLSLLSGTYVQVNKVLESTPASRSTVVDPAVPCF